jgi:cyclic beta-1,2-glucan synthetase
LDSISQTWSVLADAISGRSRQAIHAVLEKLVRRDDRLVLLLTPPFDRTELDPGYIKGYLPGIRENGGQYTHSALWLIQALAKLGCGEQAMSIFDLINPILHAVTFDGISRYRVEPYVVAADVYGVAPHTGRGGWSWYTGSASWMYRVALESLLGFQLNGTRLRIDPQLPANWTSYEMTYRRGDTTWRFVVEQNQDGQALGGDDAQNLELIDDGGTHERHVRIPRRHA